MEPKGTIATNCSESDVRTRRADCDRSEGKPMGLIITSPSALYPLDSAEFLENIESYVSADGTLRMMPVSGVVGLTHNGGDINAPDLGTYGGPRPIGLNALNDAFQIDGGDCLYKELSKLNGRRVRIFRYDDAGYLFGTVVSKDGQDYFAGFEATVFVTNTRTDGSTLPNLSITAYYSLNDERAEINKSSVYLENGMPEGLLGVMLQAVGNNAKVVAVCDQTDVTATYGDDWKTTMFINDSGTVATTATFNSETGLLTIAPAGKYRVAPAKVLAAGNITGLDGVNTLVQINAAG